MLQAAVISSIHSFEENQPWIVWTKKTPVGSLKDHAEPPQSVSDMTDVEDRSYTVPNVASAAAIQRNQYRAVMQRMNQAKGRSGQYSSWDT